MSRRQPPKKISVTPEWCERVEAALFSRQMSRSALAQKVGCNRATISFLLNGQQDSSEYVKDICRVLQIPEPNNGNEDQEFMKRVREAAGQLSEEELMMVESFIDTLIKRKANDSND